MVLTYALDPCPDAARRRRSVVSDPGTSAGYPRRSSRPTPDPALTKTRSHSLILQALLGLLFLAWLPVSGIAAAQDEFTVQYAGAAILEEWGEDAGGWSGQDGPSDADPTGLALNPTLSCPGLFPQRRHLAVPRPLRLGAAHPATGPPAV
jgi:hypothetical protein